MVHTIVTTSLLTLSLVTRPLEAPKRSITVPPHPSSRCRSLLYLWSFHVVDSIVSTSYIAGFQVVHILATTSYKTLSLVARPFEASKGSYPPHHIFHYPCAHYSTSQPSKWSIPSLPDLSLPCRSSLDLGLQVVRTLVTTSSMTLSLIAQPLKHRRGPYHRYSIALYPFGS